MKHLYRALLFVCLSASLTLVAQTTGAGPAFGFTNQPTPPVSTKAGESQFKGSRDVLQLIAERLDFSEQQESQLQNLIDREHQSIAELHQNTQMSDEQKTATFQQIQAQAKEKFVAVLTPTQQREFKKMTRQ